ncbi:MAG: glycosyltransferase family 2 protein [Candidatus Hinthialibacter antarcticus]|nr:glycosyltransferase family 2 protein [Candidatus Hinthialibacter antarcticus]
MIDVIIVNYNASSYLQSLLDALLSKDALVKSRRLQISVTVVDNASSDGSASMVETRFPQAKLIQREANDGYAAAVNEGVAATDNRVILLLNSDVFVTIDQVAALQRIWERLDFPGVLAPLHLEEDDFPQQTWGGFPTPQAELKRKRLEQGLNQREPWARREAMNEASRTREVDWVSGSCMLFPRLTLEEAGPWDQNFFLYFEDIDWCLRVKEKGLSVFHTPEVRVVHAHGASMEQDPESSEIEYRLSQCYFTLKHFGGWALWKLRFYLTLKQLGRFLLGGRSGFSRGTSWEILRNLWRNPMNQ